MLSDPSHFAAVLLAAGASTRLGQPKQLLPWQGRTLLGNAASVALAAGFSPVVVVLGSRAREMKPEVEGLAVETVLNPDWSEGMGSSLQCGMRHLTESASVDAVIVLLCDQPLVTPDYLRLLVERFLLERRLAVASQYEDGLFGPPCLFATELFTELLALSGSQGARAILGRLSPENLSLVSFPEGKMDVDTLQDWERLKKDSNE